MRIFVGSSTKGEALAKSIARDLGKEHIIQHWRRDVFRPGEHYMESLRAACRSCDFAVIVLTPDDPSEQRGQAAVLPRDNCIFEAGLFTGHLGIETRRVFLVNRADRAALPTDLAGITIIPGDQAPEMIVQAIQSNIEDLGEFIRADDRIVPLTYGQLLDREERLDGEQRVVVQSGQPIELEKTKAAKDVRGLVAERVRKNMAREVFYHYFFYANAATVDTIASLCRRLATFAEDGSRLPKEHIAKNLELLTRQLRVHFLPSPPLIDYCLHDLLSERPRLYLRNREYERFYLWSSHDTAAQFAVAVRRNVTDVWKPQYVFASTPEFDLAQPCNAQYRTALMERCLKYFDGELSPLASTALFGSKSAGV